MTHTYQRLGDIYIQMVDLYHSKLSSLCCDSDAHPKISIVIQERNLIDQLNPTSSLTPQFHVVQ